MVILPWAADNWFILLQSLGIVASLLFTGAALRLDGKARRIDNLLAITDSHRDIWMAFYERPSLSRIMDAHADLHRTPITREEEWFIRFLILHLNSVYHASKDQVLANLEGLPNDIHWFFSLPLPKVVWEKIKSVQDRGFVRFVEGCVTGNQNDR